MITSILGAMLVIVVLVAIISIMVRPPVATTGSSEISGRSARLYWGTFFQGILSAAALGASVQNAGANGWVSGLATGAVLGMLFAILVGTGDWKQLGVSALSLIFGVVGLIFDFGTYFSPQSVCTPADIGQRALGLGLVAIAVVVGSLMTFLRGLFQIRKLGTIVLAVYGALQVMEFLSSPLGVSLADLGVMAWIVSLVAAFALGFAVSIWPEFVIAVAGVALVAAGVTGTFAGSATCVPGPDFSSLAPMIGFVLMYLGVRWAAGRFLK